VTIARQDIGMLRMMRWIAIALAPGCAVAIRLALVAAPGAVILPALLLVFDLLLIARLTLVIRSQRPRCRAMQCAVEFCHDPAVAQGCCLKCDAALRMHGTATVRPLVAGVSMADMAAGMDGLPSALGGCAHTDAEPVIPSGSAETVGWVCPECDADLPAGWSPVPPSAACTCGDLPGSWRGCARHDITAGPR
jgi:hypothetical protein